VYLDIIAGRKMGLSTQILPSLFRVILFLYAHPRHIKRPKVRSCSRSSFVSPKALPAEGLRPQWPGEKSQSPDANAQAALSSATRAVSDRILARMTHMLTSSSHRARKDARGSSHRDAERTRGQDMSLRTKGVRQR